MKAARVVHHRG